LFTIDVRPYQAQLDKAKADKQIADATRAYAAADYKRLLELGPDQAASPLELEKAKQALAQADGQISAANAEIEAAALNVEWCRVVAPISGRVSRKIVTVGNLITGGQEQATLLTTIVSRDPIYCYVDVDEHSVLKYQELARERRRVSARDARIPTFMSLA